MVSNSLILTIEQFMLCYFEGENNLLCVHGIESVFIRTAFDILGLEGF